MSDADQTLARIDEVLGFTDDMSIEWDYSTSPDAMRSRPADEIPSSRRGHDIDYIIVDEAQQWRGLLDQMSARPLPDLAGSVHIALGFDGSRTADTYTFIQIGADFRQAEDGTIRRIAEGEL